MNKLKTECMNDRQYVIYHLSEEEKDSFVLGMIRNNIIDGVVPVNVIDNGNGFVLQYDITECTDVKKYTGGITNRRFLLGLYRDICKALMNAEEYMLDYNNFIIESDNVYIDSRCNARILCLPLKSYEHEHGNLCDIFKNFLVNMRFDMSEDITYVVELLNYFNQNQEASVCEIAKKIDELMETESNNIADSVHSDIRDGGILINMNGDDNDEIDLYEGIEDQEVIPTQVVNPETISHIENMMNVTKNEELRQEGVSSDSSMNDSDSLTANNTMKDDYDFSKMYEQDQLADGYNGYNEADMQNFNFEENVQLENNIDYPGDDNLEEDEANQKKGLFGFAFKKHKNKEKDKKKHKDKSKNEDAYDTDEQATTVLNDDYSNNMSNNVMRINDVMPRLIRLSNNEIIYINKPVFKIGKEINFADYCIADNPAISRAHAEVIINNGNYYVMDNNSLNHTYVDGNQIASQIRVMITDGTRIKLANEEFEFKIAG